MSDRKTKGVISILLGFGLIIVLAAFSSNYHPKRGVMGNIRAMEIVVEQGENKTDNGGVFSGHYEGRIAIPYKYVFSVGTILLFVGIGLVLLRQNASDVMRPSREPSSENQLTQKNDATTDRKLENKLSVIPLVIYLLSVLANLVSLGAEGKLQIYDLRTLLVAVGYILGSTILPLIFMIVYYVSRRDWAKKTSIIISIVWIIVVFLAYMDWSIYRSRNTQSAYDNHVKAILDVDDPFKARQNPLDDIFPTPAAKPESQQASSVSGETSRDAYLKMLDTYISDGTPAVRLQVVADPAFVTFLSLKDTGTGRLIRDIAEEADRKQDAATMSDVYKSFFKWRQNTMSQR